MKQPKYQVYKIVNLANGLIYIGGTSDGKDRRWEEHKRKAHQGYESPLYRAIREYGEEAFISQVIEDCDSAETLNEREIYWIAKLSSTNPEIGYNVHAGGNIFYHTPETKLKISRIHSGKISEQRVAILQYDYKGNFIKEYSSITEAAADNNIYRSTIIRSLEKKVTRPTKKNLFIWLYKDNSKEVEPKINPSEYYLNINYKATPSTECVKKRTKYQTVDGDMTKVVTPVEQYDLNGNLVSKYYSISEASKQTGVSSATIRKQINNPDYVNTLKRKDRIKYIWRKADPNDPEVQITNKELIAKVSKKKSRVIQAFDENGVLIKEYANIKEFEKAEHADRRTMTNSIVLNQPWRGYYWKIITN